jgi:hypothetical protein
MKKKGRINNIKTYLCAGLNGGGVMHCESITMATIDI